MAESALETKNKIVESAKKEFLDKGFINASLRTIAANAGLTTGALYRHFKDKDSLFCALVDAALEKTRQAVMTADVALHQKEDNPVGPEHEQHESKTIAELLDYIYEDFDAFTLLLTKSAGSTHENFLDDMCELYTSNCIETFKWLHKEDYAKKCPDTMTVHVIASSIINAFAEIIIHKLPKKDAVKFIADVRDLFHYGTMHLMGIPCE